MWGVVLLAALVAVSGLADERVRVITERLAAEAATFRKAAPDLVSQETLQQRALKPVKRKFAPHLGTEPPRVPEWQEREIVSDYAFATFDEEQSSLREFRRPISVDGKPIAGGDRGVDALAASIHAPSDREKRKLLENFEKLGLIGTISDFGQLILLFDSRGVDHFEFQILGQKLIGAERMVTVGYRQVDGPPALTVWSRGEALRCQVSGEILMQADNLRVRKITMVSVAGNGRDSVRQEAEVEYTVTRFQAVAPVAVTHREFRAGQMTAENRFRYAPFEKFGGEREKLPVK